MLLIWTGADVRTIKEVLEPTFKALETPIRCLGLDEDPFAQAADEDVILAMGTKALGRLQAGAWSPKTLR